MPIPEDIHRPKIYKGDEIKVIIEVQVTGCLNSVARTIYRSSDNRFSIGDKLRYKGVAIERKKPCFVSTSIISSAIGFSLARTCSSIVNASLNVVCVISLPADAPAGRRCGRLRRGEHRRIRIP